MVKVYVVSVYSNFTGELISEIVRANNLYEAFENAEITKDWVEEMPPRVLYLADEFEDKTLEDLKQYMFDNDHAVNIIRID